MLSSSVVKDILGSVAIAGAGGRVFCHKTGVEELWTVAMSNNQQ